MVQHGIEKYQFPIFITWVGGVTLFGLKFLLSIAYVEFLSSTSQAMYCQDTYRAFRRVSKHYRVNQNISIGESKYVKTPMILGFFKPVILFPIGLVNQLDISETEAILAHELAHFTRKDIYINIVQTMIEIVLYYHPAIWWISANIRLERESCCDELAIHYTGNNIHYAKTLVKIQEINQASNQPSLALYFNKKESFFSNRIKRILNMTQTRNYLKEKIITSVVLVVVILFATRDLTGNTNKVTIEGNTSTQKTIAATISFDTIPNQKEKVQIQKKSDTQDYKISMEDGKVIELEINGKKIDADDYDKYDDIIKESKPSKIRSRNGNMFFFDDGNKGEFKFGFGSPMNMDSLFGSFEGGFHHFPRFEGHGMDEEKWNEQMEKLYGQLGKIKNLKELQSLDAYKKSMEEMEKSLGKMKFGFRDMDSIRFHFDDFNFGPQLEFGDDSGVKIYGFGQNGKNDPPMFAPEEYGEGNWGQRSKNFTDIVGGSLNKDGLLIPEKENKVEITGKYLKINGEKQPNNIFQKYKRIFEETSGAQLEKDSKIQFNFFGKESKKKFRVY